MVYSPLSNVRYETHNIQNGENCQEEFPHKGEQVDEKLKKAIGERLDRAFREGAGIENRKVIAEHLGFAKDKAVYKKLSGDQELNYEQLITVSKLTGHSIDLILTGHGEPPPSPYKFLEEGQREIIEGLSKLKDGGKLDETLHQLLMEGVKARMKYLTDKSPALSAKEGEELALIVQLVIKQISPIEEPRTSRKTNSNKNGK